jgi:hypothetical protein
MRFTINVICNYQVLKVKKFRMLKLNKRMDHFEKLGQRQEKPVIFEKIKTLIINALAF